MIFRLFPFQPTNPSWGLSRTHWDTRKFTLRDTFLDQNQVLNILLWVPVSWDGSVSISVILKPKLLRTGKQILSLTTYPARYSIHQSSDPKSLNPIFDHGVLIESGERGLS